MSRDSSGAGSSSPRAPPQHGQQLRERVSFFEAFSSRNSAEDLVDEATGRRSSSRASNSSFEESYEKLVEEGDYQGAKLVKFEKITVKKSLKEVTLRWGL